MESHGRARAPFYRYSPTLSAVLLNFFSSFFLILPRSLLKSGASRSFFSFLSHPSISSSLTHVSLPNSRSLPPPLLSLCISCIVNSSQKHDKVSTHVPPASLSVLPAICYCLLAIVCLSLSRFLYSVFPLRQKSKS